MRRSFGVGRAVLAAWLLAWAVSGAAQDWPTKALRVVVPFPPGSATDLVARLVSKEIGDAVGQALVIENRPGAGGSIAAEHVARSAPDGYTLLVASNTQYAANVSLFAKLPYDPVRDFTPVARLSSQPTVLLVRPEFPAKTLAEFIAHVRANPGKLSAGYGASSAQVAIAQMGAVARLDVTLVPYKGIPLAVTDVIGGAIDFTFGDVGAAITQVAAGKLRAVAVTSATRFALTPDWPAIAEMYPGYEIIGWHAMTAPAGTPAMAIAKLQDAALRALTRPHVLEALTKLGLTPAPQTSTELGAYIREEVARWSAMIKEAGIKPE